MAGAEDRSVLQMQAAGARLLQSSPGLAEKLAMTGKTGTVSRTSLNGRVDDRDSTLHDLRLQLDSEKDKNRSLEDSYKFRVATFVKRETTTRNKIDSLERKLNEGSEGDEHLVRMDVVRNMHKSVVSSLECIQNNTSKILQDQEKDLMRAFRNRLQEVSKEHEALKSRKGEHSSELQAKHRRVLGELYEAQELAQTFDKKNKTLQTENQRLQEQLRSREDDRSALLKDLVMTKKEVARLKLQSKEEEEAEGTATNKAAAEQAQATQKKSFSQKQVEQARQQQTQNKLYEREMSYREAITKLKRMVEAERQVARGIKQQQAALLEGRTELEVLLTQCLEDVNSEIRRHQAQSPGLSPKGMQAGSPQAIATLSLKELNAQERERVLELLLSQQRVVQLLYRKSFSQNMPTPLSPEDTNLGATSKSEGRGDEFSWLGSVLPERGGGE